MGSAHSLPGGSSGGYRCRNGDLTSGSVSREAKSARRPDARLAAGEGAEPGDRFAGAAIPRGFGLEEAQHPLRAVRRPHGDELPVSLAQRLR
jgi:hypothetical protein